MYEKCKNLTNENRRKNILEKNKNKNKEKIRMTTTISADYMREPVLGEREL